MKTKPLLLLITSVACASLYAQKSSTQKHKAQLFWTQEVIMPITQHNCRTISVREVRNGDENITRNYQLINCNGTIAFLSDNKDLLFLGKTLKMACHETQEIFEGNDEDEYENHYVQNVFGNQYLRPLLLRGKGLKGIRYDISVSNLTYDTIDGCSYTIIHYKDQQRYHYNDSTQRFDCPDFYDVSYYLNMQTHLIEYIRATPMQTSGNQAIFRLYEQFITISFDDQRDLLRERFNFARPEFAAYSHHDDHFAPYSTTVWNGNGKTETLTDAVLDYPIVNIAGDTTTIRQEEGWILLDFWFLGCKSCYENMHKMQQERDSLGYYLLDSLGVRTLFINPLSDNVQRLTELGENYSLLPHFYHAKGIGNILDVSVMPKSFLITPTKRVALVMQNKVDYKQIQTVINH